MNLNEIKISQKKKINNLIAYSLLLPLTKNGTIPPTKNQNKVTTAIGTPIDTILVY